MREIDKCGREQYRRLSRVWGQDPLGTQPNTPLTFLHYVVGDLQRQIDELKKSSITESWKDAKVGEVWVLSTADGETAAYSVMAVREAGIVFESDEGRYSLADADIESGRRIYPEDES